MRSHDRSREWTWEGARRAFPAFELPAPRGGGLRCPRRGPTHTAAATPVAGTASPTGTAPRAPPTHRPTSRAQLHLRSPTPPARARAPRREARRRRRARGKARGRTRPSAPPRSASRRCFGTPRPTGCRRGRWLAPSMGDRARESRSFRPRPRPEARREGTRRPAYHWRLPPSRRGSSSPARGS